MKKLLYQTLSFLIIAGVLSATLSQEACAYNQKIRNDTPFILSPDATFAGCDVRRARDQRPGDNPDIGFRVCLLKTANAHEIRTTNIQPAWVPPSQRWTDPNPRTITLSAQRWTFSGTGAGAEAGQWVVRGPYVAGRDGKEVLLYQAEKRDANDPTKGWNLTAIAAEAGTGQPTGVPYIYRAGTGTFKVTRE